MLGFGAGLESSTRIIMPALASYLLGRFGPSTPGILGSVVMIVVVAYAYVSLASIGQAPDMSSQT
ncbi:MAG TPA: hypothetical protein DCY14_08055 [Anaerolineae bacterium]|nr:hypothetical protein [Anaerolineae bacterium]